MSRPKPKAPWLLWPVGTTLIDVDQPHRPLAVVTRAELGVERPRIGVRYLDGSELGAVNPSHFRRSLVPRWPSLPVAPPPDELPWCLQVRCARDRLRSRWRR